MSDRCDHQGMLYAYSADEMRGVQAQLARTGARLRAIEECRGCGVVQVMRRARPGFQSMEQYESLAEVRAGRPFDVTEMRLPRYAQPIDAVPVGISV